MTKTFSLRAIDEVVAKAEAAAEANPLRPYIEVIDGKEYWAFPDPKQAAAILAFVNAFNRGDFDELINAADEARIVEQLRAKTAPLPPFSIRTVKGGEAE